MASPKFAVAVIVRMGKELRVILKRQRFPLSQWDAAGARLPYDVFLFPSASLLCWFFVVPLQRLIQIYQAPACCDPAINLPGAQMPQHRLHRFMDGGRECDGTAMNRVLETQQGRME